MQQASLRRDRDILRMWMLRFASGDLSELTRNLIGFFDQSVRSWNAMIFPVGVGALGGSPYARKTFRTLDLCLCAKVLAKEYLIMNLIHDKSPKLSTKL